MTDVAVAGGGLIGLAVAWRAAQRGLSVTVVDDAPGSGASRGMARGREAAGRVPWSARRAPQGL